MCRGWLNEYNLDIVRKGAATPGYCSCSSRLTTLTTFMCVMFLILIRWPCSFSPVARRQSLPVVLTMLKLFLQAKKYLKELKYHIPCYTEKAKTLKQYT